MPKKSNFHELLALILEQQQRLQHQILLSDAVFTEFVDEVSRQFDEIHYAIEALKNRSADNLDQAIENEKVKHLKQQVLILSKHLHRLEEQNAKYGLAAPPHLAIQIDEYRDQLAAVTEEIKQWTNS